MEIRLIPKIKKIRKEKGFSQEGFAQKINISTSELSKYENAKRIPGAVALWKIAIGLGCKVDSLYEYKIVN